MFFSAVKVLTPYFTAVKEILSFCYKRNIRILSAVYTPPDPKNPFTEAY